MAHKTNINCVECDKDITSGPICDGFKCQECYNGFKD